MGPCAEANDVRKEDRHAIMALCQLERPRLAHRGAREGAPGRGGVPVGRGAGEAAAAPPGLARGDVRKGVADGGGTGSIPSICGKDEQVERKGI